MRCRALINTNGHGLPGSGVFLAAFARPGNDRRHVAVVVLFVFEERIAVIGIVFDIIGFDVVEFILVVGLRGNWVCRVDLYGLFRFGAGFSGLSSSVTPAGSRARA